METLLREQPADVLRARREGRARDGRGRGERAGVSSEEHPEERAPELHEVSLGERALGGPLLVHVDPVLQPEVL